MRCCKLVVLYLFISYCDSAQVLSANIASCISNNQYFDTTLLSCSSCTSPAQVSSNGLTCECPPTYYYTANSGGNTVKCSKCDPQKVTSLDGWSCVSCDSSLGINQAGTACASCNASSVAVELTLAGNPMTSSQCQLCVANATPSATSQRCQTCPQYEFVKQSSGCSCSSTGSLTDAGSFCFPTTAVTIPSLSAAMYQIPDLVNPAAVTANSYYLQANIRSAFGQCSIAYQNTTACQIMANFCTLLLNRKINVGSANNDACDLWNTLSLQTRTSIQGNNDQKSGMPFLYYSSVTELTGTQITTQFNRYSTLQLHASVFTLNGSFAGFSNFSGGLFQLCKGSESEMNAAYNFGTIFFSTCTLTVDSLFDENKYQLYFYDPYIYYQSTAGTFRHTVPVLLLQYLNSQGNLVNQDANSNNWQLTRRFFLVDNQAAKQSATQRATFVRYAANINIVITQVNGDTTGTIYTPYISISYAKVLSTDFGQGKTVQVSFSVQYKSDTVSFYYKLSVAMGTMCALAIVYSVLRTWSWSKRAGQVSVDGITVLKFFVFVASAISNVFLLVTFGLTFWYLVFYKNQTQMTLFVLSSDQENNIAIYIGVAFGLKLVEVLHLIISQSFIDIFFIDWEKAVKQMNRNEKSAPTADGTNNTETRFDNGVSIWRTYFAANEWNEIQSYRKTSRTFNIMAALLFLNVIGFENYGTQDPFGNLNYASNAYKAPYSLSFRFALIVSVWVIIAVAQWLFYMFFYKQFVEDKLTNYVDLCSVSNISVFIMAQRQFGYYIHGQNVNGKADVSLAQMYANFEREQRGVCAKRGMDMDSDNQTFMMALPNDMRIEFDKLYMPFAEGGNLDQSLDTYHKLNDFLKAFLSKSNPRKMEYVTKPRLLFEDILDCEFDPYLPGKFYFDDGSSFGNVLFYGHELTLVTFDVLVFCVIDLAGANNIVLNCIIVWLVGWLVDVLRDNLSSRNLAKKTLVDERFLI